MQGYVSILDFRDPKGRIIPVQKAIENGWVQKPEKVPAGWGADRDEVGIGANTFLDTGRQALCYAFGNSSPISNYVCTHFGVGTGTTPVNTGDVGLVNPIAFDGDSTYAKLVGGITFPSPYVAQVQLPLASGECNGYLITELGLFTASGVLLARKIDAGINKDSSYSPTLLWRVRF